MNILYEINGASTIGLAGHVNPDGDALGSVCGLGRFLQKAFPNARVEMFSEPFKESLGAHIHGSEMLRTDFSTEIEKFDVFIALDTSAERLSGARDYFLNAKKSINIDHHRTNPGEGDVNIIDKDASATCEIVYDLIAGSELPDGTSGLSLMDAAIAETLYTGIVTDTGVFKYSNTSEKTMRIGGSLISYGFDKTKLIDDVFYSKTYLENQLLGRALVESVLFRDKTCIFSVLDRKALDFFGATSKDLDGISSQLKLTTGVQCAIFLSELEEGTFKVSLRSGEEIDVAEIASAFGGGGHARAAGMTVTASKYKIINAISDRIEQQLAGKAAIAGERE